MFVGSQRVLLALLNLKDYWSHFWLVPLRGACEVRPCQGWPQQRGALMAQRGSPLAVAEGGVAAPGGAGVLNLAVERKQIGISYMYVRKHV